MIASPRIDIALVSADSGLMIVCNQLANELMRLGLMTYSESQSCMCFVMSDKHRWASIEAKYVFEHFVDQLDLVAPEGCFFGENPKNTGSYGYWRKA